MPTADASGGGEMGEMDKSVDQLRQAYKYKANLIPGESLPDPLKDYWFRKFTGDGKFVRRMRDMQRD